MARVNVPVTDITPVKASLTTSLTGTNNDLVFTAKKGGSWGNSIQVAYIDPGGTSATLSVVVSGFLITVNLGRTASAIDTIASVLTAAIQASADANSLVDVANAAANDGTGLVTALTATALTGGGYATTPPSQVNGDSTNKHYLTGNDGRVFIEVVSSDASPQNVTIQPAPDETRGVAVTAEVYSVPNGATRLLGPFLTSLWNQNGSGDVYFDPAVSTNLKFRAYRVTQAT